MFQHGEQYVSARLRGGMTWAAVANFIGAGGVKSIPIVKRPEGTYGEFLVVYKP